MATTPVIVQNAKDKTKDWQLELLMEKLRTKASQLKSFSEISKTVRMVMLDKRFSLDSVEKSQHQRCLDTLQHCIKVTSLQSMVERLESLTRQLGLKFVMDPSGIQLFISSDMFYLEIILEETGVVREVKVHHEDKAEQSCAELVSCLAKQDFADFTAQLEGFASIYQLNAEKKVKRKAFTALQSLEFDLNTLAQLQTFMKEPFNLLHKSPVGILEKRRGGHPMKLTYFVSPYDLINIDKCELEAITIDTVISKNLGYSVTVCMEGSAAHKLQTSTLISVTRNLNGKSTPTFATLTNQNSAVIPACFVLKLNKPMPMCVSFVKQIQQLTELECADISSPLPLLSLIVTHASYGKLDGNINKGFFVSLPDQNHCYFMTENKSMEAILVNSIPFTHPGHVSQILVILRQQALFNSLISSCIRPKSKQDFESMIMFEISALSWTHISISLEHPVEETMATAELDLSDISNLQCTIHSPGASIVQGTVDTESELATKVLNHSLSIPITMRSVIKLWDKQVVRKNNFGGHENFSLPLEPGDPGGSKGPTGDGLNNFGGLDDKMKQEPNGNGNLPHAMNLTLMSQSHQGVFLNESMMASANFSQYPTTEAPVLSNIELTNILSGSGKIEKPTKHQYKQRASDDSWKSMKRKSVDDPEMLLEGSSNDSTSRSTLLSQETPSEINMMTPNSALGFHSDLELSGLDPAEIKGVSDKSTLGFGNLNEIDDVDDVMTIVATGRDSRKALGIQKSPLHIDSVETKTLVSPTVSITAVTSQGFQSLGGSGMERQSSVEMVPLAMTPPTSIPSSLTITPISSSHLENLEERSRDKKSSKSRSDDKGRSEKKRKRKRDESPMGPPDKIPAKQDALSKPVSVSIKAAESPPTLSITPTSPNMIRKFTTSPTQSKNFSVSGKLSPSSLKSSLKSSSIQQSPKHSPAHVPSSPKHSISGISSPKNHGTSPKHPSSSSGKPSMSTLKTAANSPSHKLSNDSNKKFSYKDSSREKDKKSGFSSNKTKSGTKLKQLDLSSANDANLLLNISENLPSPTAITDLSKSVPAQVRNRKGSLSAIVDKLISAQHCDGVTDLSTKSSSSRERSGSVNKIIEGSKSFSKVSGEIKNSEYMVKPSSDGMKITINKTRSKESSKLVTKSQSTSGTGSPKTHTGLKPGVNSGPASKKPQQLLQKSSTSPNISSPSSYSSPIKSGSSCNSKSLNPKGLNLINSSISSKIKTSSATDLSRSKDKSKLNKSSSEKSIFSSSRDRKSSPTQGREETDSEKAFKFAMSKMDPYSSTPLITEGLIKQLDKNFQIPKLSARNVDEKKMSINKINSGPDTLNNINNTKIYDIISKNDLGFQKYPVAVPTSKLFENSMEAKMRNNLNVVSSTINNSLSVSNVPNTKSSVSMTHKELKDYKIEGYDNERKKDLSKHINIIGKEDGYKHNFPLSKFLPPNADVSTKTMDLSSKFSTFDKLQDTQLYPKELGEVLLDFSSTSNKLCDRPTYQYPSTSSVSVHIVKSPAPTANIDSASPCISDDELMDEALVGVGK